jgi:hypothetical protein
LSLAGVIGMRVHRQIVRIVGDSDGRGMRRVTPSMASKKRMGENATLGGPAMGEEGG